MVQLMALDVGTSRIGVAISDASSILASPYTTIHVTGNEQQTWHTIKKLIAETDTESLIVGLPISLDGQIHGQGKRIQTFVERLRQHIHIPITFWDERLSTVEAERLLRERGLDEGGKRHTRGGSQRNKRRKGQEIDALAAAVILQDYMDHQDSLKEKINETTE